MKHMLSIAFSLFVLFTESASAEWTKIKEGKVYHIYTDMKALSTQPEGTYVWALYDFIHQQPEGYRSAKVLFQIDCKEERYKMLAVNTFAESMGEGQAGQPVASKTWENATKNSLGHSVLTVVCK